MITQLSLASVARSAEAIETRFPSILECGFMHVCSLPSVPTLLTFCCGSPRRRPILSSCLRLSLSFYLYCSAQRSSSQERDSHQASRGFSIISPRFQYSFLQPVWATSLLDRVLDICGKFCSRLCSAVSALSFVSRCAPSHNSLFAVFLCKRIA